MPPAKDPFRSPKRAQRACELCQIAKVRCNAVAGSPCSHCKRRGVKCVIDDRSRRRFQRRMPPKISEVLPMRLGGDSSLGCARSHTESLEINSFLETNEDAAVFPSDTKSDQYGLLPEWRMPTLNPTHLHLSSFNIPLLPDSLEEDLWSIFTNLNSAGLSPSERSDLEATLPGFIRPLPMSMNSAIVEYLRTNGALTIPSIPLQNALLQTFAKCVLPCMPIIEWYGFLSVVHDRDGVQGHISLLLFHAVMFSATPFVEQKHLLEAGFSNRREAHEVFFQRTKLLYESDYESDELTIIQALLLMTYRFETTDGKDSRHWVGVAISMALPMGLFKGLSGAEPFLYNPKLWKRVGWACYMTDCLISLRLRCRPRIQKVDFCHRMLTEDDFELYRPPPENPLVFPAGIPVRNVKEQRDLALMCIANIRLCVRISEVLNIQGKNDYLQPFITTTTERNNPDYIARALTSDIALGDWLNSLPPSCQYRPLVSDHLKDEEPTVLVQRSLLHMTYYTVLSVLHQSQLLPSSNIRMHHAARQITRIASELHDRKLHNCLSIIGVTSIMVAMIIHISEMKIQPSHRREEAMENFQSCMEVMASLRDVYSEANAITPWMVKAMENVALGGGSGFGTRAPKRSPSSDPAISPCSLNSMASGVNIPYPKY